MEQLESEETESFKDQLQRVLKPYQQEQNRRQKKSDFLAQCIQCVERGDFFQLDELLQSKQAEEILGDADFQSCCSLFDQLRKFAQTRVDRYSIKLKGILTELAEKADLPLKIDIPNFSVLKGIEGKLDFPMRRTVINQTTLKSIDPKRIISTLVKLKRSLYDAPFDPQLFIDSLLQCYREILKEEGRGEGDVVPIHQLYTDYVWSLQSKTFFQNMDKGKFKGYSIEQFAVDIWRFFSSDVSSAAGGYRIRLNPGRGKSFWLIDQNGERRHIVHVLFTKN
jgi:hypothetical protein